MLVALLTSRTSWPGVRRHLSRVSPAQKLAQTRPGARGAVLMSAGFDPSEYGDGRPANVAVQVHGKDADPEFANEWDLPAARTLVEEATEGELFLYPGEESFLQPMGGSAFTGDAIAAYAKLLFDPDRRFTCRLIAAADRVAGIPSVLVQGRYAVATPVVTAATDRFAR